MKPIPLLLCLTLIAAGAVAHGAATRRWAALAPADGKAERLHAHVVQFADYRAEPIPNDMPVKEKSTATSRRYASAALGVTAAVTVVSGPPGAVATHAPDVCYPSSGYKTVRPPSRVTIDLPGGGKARYYVAEFEKVTATQTDRQKVRWGWSADGTWDAPDHPRWTFLRAPDLAKVYIVTSTAGPDADGSTEDAPAVRQFVAAVLSQYAGLVAGR